jgi:hypothetical protein
MNSNWTSSPIFTFLNIILINPKNNETLLNIITQQDVAIRARNISPSLIKPGCEKKRKRRSKNKQIPEPEQMDDISDAISNFGVDTATFYTDTETCFGDDTATCYTNTETCFGTDTETCFGTDTETCLTDVDTYFGTDTETCLETDTCFNDEFLDDDLNSIIYEKDDFSKENLQDQLIPFNNLSNQILDPNNLPPNMNYNNDTSYTDLLPKINYGSESTSTPQLVPVPISYSQFNFNENNLLINDITTPAPATETETETKGKKNFEPIFDLEGDDKHNKFITHFSEILDKFAQLSEKNKAVVLVNFISKLENEKSWEAVQDYLLGPNNL